MKDFLKKFTILLTKIFTKKALIYIIIFLLIIILRSTKSNAFSKDELSYSGFTDEQIDTVYSLVQEYKGNYDSVLCAYACNPNATNGYEKYNFLFYNYETNGKIYKEISNNANQQYRIRSHYSYTDSVLVTTTLLDGQVMATAYNDAINRPITNLAQGDPTQYVADYSIPCAFASNRSIYTDDTYSNIWFQASDVSITNTAPYIINYSSIPSWDFNYMQIGGYVLAGDTSNATYYYTLYANINNGEYSSSLNVKPYLRAIDNVPHYQISVPRQQLLGNYNIQPDDVVQFTLRMKLSYRGGTITDDYNLGTYTLGISQTEADNINSNSNKQQLQNIENELNNLNNNQQQTTQAVEDNTQAVQENTEATQHLENTITDDTVTSTASDLPSIDVTDPSQNGIDNIFQSIYNAFCTGQAQDIIFPIPFTNKNITLNPYYIRDMLNNNGASWIYTLIQAFWGYLIGRYIVKDISRKITKIKGGNIENLENENIKEEML